jgi:hypothetical protein
MFHCSGLKNREADAGTAELLGNCLVHGGMWKVKRQAGYTRNAMHAGRKASMMVH